MAANGLATLGRSKRCFYNASHVYRRLFWPPLASSHHPHLFNCSHHQTQAQGLALQDACDDHNKLKALQDETRCYQQHLMAAPPLSHTAAAGTDYQSAQQHDHFAPDGPLQQGQHEGQRRPSFSGGPYPAASPQAASQPPIAVAAAAAAAAVAAAAAAAANIGSRPRQQAGEASSFLQSIAPPSTLQVNVPASPRQQLGDGVISPSSLTAAGSCSRRSTPSSYLSLPAAAHTVRYALIRGGRDSLSWLPLWVGTVPNLSTDSSASLLPAIPSTEELTKPVVAPVINPAAAPHSATVVHSTRKRATATAKPSRARAKRATQPTAKRAKRVPAAVQATQDIVSSVDVGASGSQGKANDAAVLAATAAVAATAAAAARMARP